jgi:hypothetical protein
MLRADAADQNPARELPKAIGACVPRVAFLADSFHEVNGAAMTCRALAAFAGRRGYPFLSVRFARNQGAATEGAYQVQEFRRGPLSIGVDPDLRFDLTFYRLRERLDHCLRQFAPDVIHVMGPGELGILGALAAWRMGVPLVASWHTNIHEYAARRLPLASSGTRAWMEEFVLSRILRLYRAGAVLLAPSPELVNLLQQRAGKPARLMGRGVDSAAFSPQRRRRTDGTFVIGYVGRLMPEKGVRFFARLSATSKTGAHARRSRFWRSLARSGSPYGPVARTSEVLNGSDGRGHDDLHVWSKSSICMKSKDDRGRGVLCRDFVQPPVGCNVA